MNIYDGKNTNISMIANNSSLDIAQIKQSYPEKAGLPFSVNYTGKGLRPFRTTKSKEALCTGAVASIL